MTPHGLRHTYISGLLALGWDVPTVMAEVGHASSQLTLGVYAHVMRRDAGARERLRALFDGTELAPAGTGGFDTAPEPLIAALTTPVNPPR